MKIAPGRKTASPIFVVIVPISSCASVSGVNCTRLNDTPITRAVALASSVFALPGGPSSRTWPPAIAATRRSSIASSCPTTTFATSIRASRRSSLR